MKSGSSACAVPFIEKLGEITTVSFSFISETFPGLVLVGAVLRVGAVVGTGRSVTLRLRLAFGVDAILFASVEGSCPLGDVFASSTDVFFPVVVAIPAAVDVSTG